jgi:FtsH-binding integral membrane protein
MELSHTQSGAGKLRATFFGRVIMLFGLALGASAVGSYVGFNFGLDLMIGRPGIMLLAFVIELVLIFTSHWWKQVRPLNYILFSFFTFITGFTLAPLLYLLIAQGNGELIYRALAATMLTFAAAGLIAWKTDINMFRLQGLLFFGLVGMIIVGLIGIFFPFSSSMEGIYSFFGIMLFTGFIMFDIQRLRFNAVQNEMDIALQLYLDIFNLFLFILRFLNRDR